MAHISLDFKTKKAFRAAIEAGDVIKVYQPGGIFPLSLRDVVSQRVGNEMIDIGITVVEAPSEYHKWYSEVLVRNDTHQVVKILS